MQTKDTLYRLRRVHWPIWLRVIVNFPRTNILTWIQCPSFNCVAMQILLVHCLRVDSTYHELMTGQKGSNLNRFARLSVEQKCYWKIGCQISVASYVARIICVFVFIHVKHSSMLKLQQKWKWREIYSIWIPLIENFKLEAKKTR